MKAFSFDASESRQLLQSVPPRVAADVRFVDAVAQDDITSDFVIQASPANVTAVGLHGLVQSGTFVLMAPADRAADLRSFLSGLAFNSRALLRALSTTRAVGGGGILPPSIRVLYPGDVVRFNDKLPQGVVTVVVNMNAITSTYPNTGVSLADAKFGASPVFRWFFDDPGPQQRLGFIQTPYRIFNLTPEASAPSFGNSVGRYLSPTARFLNVRFISTGLSRLTSESATFALWFRDLHDGYWCHHPDDDLVAGRRGAIDTTHDTETYALTGNVDMFAVVALSGSSLKYSYSIMDADR